MIDPQRTAPPSSFRWRGWFYGLLVFALVVVVKFVPLQELLQQCLDWVHRMGPWGPLFFMLIYVVATLLFLPGSALTLGAGAAFGVVWGSLYVSIASTVGATLAFLLGRGLARQAVVRKFEGNRRFAALDKAVAAEGWKIVLLTRLSPGFPFTVLNYAFGLTQVTLSHYILASWIGMMPGTVLYVYLGSLAKAATGERTRTPGEWILLGVGLLATVGVTVFVTRLAKKALAQRINP